MICQAKLKSGRGIARVVCDRLIGCGILEAEEEEDDDLSEIAAAIQPCFRLPS